MDLSYEGVWQSGRHYDYYDSVTYNGSTWACLNKNGSSSEPGTDADWQEIASKGSKGDKGDGYTQMGQFKTGMVVPKMGVVSMGGGSYVAKHPLPILPCGVGRTMPATGSPSTMADMC